MSTHIHLPQTPPILPFLYKCTFCISIFKFKQFNFRESCIITYNSNSSSLAWAISYDSTYFIDGENEDPGKGYDLSRLQGESGLQAGPAAGILDRSPRPGRYVACGFWTDFASEMQTPALVWVLWPLLTVTISSLLLLDLIKFFESWDF